MVTGLPEGETGHERPDDGGQLRGVGERGEEEQDREGGDGHRRRGTAEAMHAVEYPRDAEDADDSGDRQEADGEAECRCDGAHTDGPIGDDLDDDGEDDETEHVIGDRRSEHHP